MTPDPLERALRHLQVEATPFVMASAELELTSGGMCSVRAGGPGVCATVYQGRWTTLEVLLSGPAPRFWQRYSAGEDLSTYAYVPPLLVAHLVIRSGGIRTLDLRTQKRARVGILDLKVAVPEGAEAAVQAALDRIRGTQVLVSRFSLNERV